MSSLGGMRPCNLICGENEYSVCFAGKSRNHYNVLLVWPSARWGYKLLTYCNVLALLNICIISEIQGFFTLLPILINGKTTIYFYTKDLGDVTENAKISKYNIIIYSHDQILLLAIW